MLLVVERHGGLFSVLLDKKTRGAKSLHAESIRKGFHVAPVFIAFLFCTR
jgi:hypothetical protein